MICATKVTLSDTHMTVTLQVQHKTGAYMCGRSHFRYVIALMKHDLWPNNASLVGRVLTRHS